MTIRKAKIEDSKVISEHLFLAMEEILYDFLGRKNEKDAKRFLRYFIERENNQYSFQNCIVAAIGKEVLGTVLIYDGGELDRLREPIAQYFKTELGKDFDYDNETQPGEYYIDSIGVNPSHQGKGIGSQLLQFVINEYVTNDHYTLGLLVDEVNPQAEKLYLKLGFELVGRKFLAGHQLKHFQLKPT